MARIMQLLAAVILAVPSVLAQGGEHAPDTGRPCGFKIAPCPTDMSCSWRDPACPMTRGENCPGNCMPATAVPTVATTTRIDPEPTIPPPEPTPTHQYDDCGGKRIKPKDCPEGHICIDNPYRGGCGMACDAPGICVKPEFCGGIAGIRCRDGKKCFDNPTDSCNARSGGRDCGGICV